MLLPPVEPRDVESARFAVKDFAVRKHHTTATTARYGPSAEGCPRPVGVDSQNNSPSFDRVQKVHVDGAPARTHPTCPSASNSVRDHPVHTLLRHSPFPRAMARALAAWWMHRCVPLAEQRKRRRYHRPKPARLCESRELCEWGDRSPLKKQTQGGALSRGMVVKV